MSPELEAEVRAQHAYGPIHDDYGQHIGYGCTWDHESWPCRRLITLGGHTAIPTRRTP